MLVAPSDPPVPLLFTHRGCSANIRSLTAQGSPYARFRRALDIGNCLDARSAASEMEHVGLAEALELVLLIAEKEPVRFERAALRWHGRYCREIRDVDPHEAEAVLALLFMLRGRRRDTAAQSLADLIYRRGLERACEALVRSAAGS